MERRELLQMGGLLGITALGGGAGCLPGLMSGTPRMPQADVDKLLATIDANLERISRYDMLDDFTRRANTNFKYTDDDRALARMSMRALYTSAMFRGMPEEAQLDPGVQERVIGQMGEMDAAVFGMADRLAALDEQRRDHVRAALHDKKTQPEAISQVFDRGMGTLEMPLGRRFQMRSIFSQVGFRMQKQPAMVIDEYVGKVNKSAALIGSQVELQRRIAAQIGQDAYWKHQQRLALMLADDPGTTAGAGGPPATSAPPTSAPVPVVAPNEVDILMTNVRFAAERGQCEAVEFLGKRIADLDEQVYRSRYLTDKGVIECKQYLRQREAALAQQAQAAGDRDDCSDARSMANGIARSKVIGTGGWMLGIGLVVGVLGIAAVDGAGALGAVALTIGAGLLVGGLIVLVVGASMASQ